MRMASVTLQSRHKHPMMVQIVNLRVRNKYSNDGARFKVKLDDEKEHKQWGERTGFNRPKISLADEGLPEMSCV